MEFKGRARSSMRCTCAQPLSSKYVPARSDGARTMSLDAWPPNIVLKAASRTLLPEPLSPEMTVKPGPNWHVCWATKAKSAMVMDSKYVLAAELVAARHRVCPRCSKRALMVMPRLANLSRHPLRILAAPQART